ncbi:PGN_0703 family putative restriction endonuclease [Bradyrhizobium sp. AZCC 1699]|uniref:PGN_0703 family putative restriction endonuclease n=1 Tax=Bradyrhizobium sp. AZCC 1699 TaxID=3117024 RepID=UPI002FF3B6C2
MHNPSTTPSPADHPSSSVPTFKQLSRTPFVSDAVAKHFDSHCLIDSRFRRAARLLQILWMRDQGIPSAAVEERGAHLGSYLRADAAESGRNFISPQVHLLALRELLLREEDAAIDEDRLVTNTLSSMPLVFNVFGPLALDTDLATAVFRQMLPDFVHSVERIAFEHSPGRRDGRYLADRSAFDIAVHIVTPEGEAGIVYAEVKYSEDMTGPVAKWRERYSQALKEVRLYKNPDSAILRSPPIEQLMREHMLAQLSVDHGITPRAVFIGIAPRLNRRADAAFRVYANELLPVASDDPTRVRFQHFTLETLIDAIDVAGDRETADQLWKRYCDFQRVYDAALAVIAPKALCSEPPISATAPPSADAKSKTRPRKAGSRTRRTQPDGPAGVSETAETYHGTADKPISPYAAEARVKGGIVA